MKSHGIPLFFLLLTLSARSAEEAPGRALLSRMEPGSIIKDLLVPSYNDAKLLTSVLRADQLLVETESQCRAEHITLQLTANHARRDIAPAVFVIRSSQFNLDARELRSESPVRAVSPHYFVQSQGLITHLGTGRAVTAFFLPPVIGCFNPSPRLTAMNAPIRSLMGATLITCAVAQQRPLPSPAQLAPMQQHTPSSLSASASPTAIQEQFRHAESRSQPATAALQQFVKTQNLTLDSSSTADDVQSVLNDQVKAASDMPAFQPQADAIGFSCQGGAFYDHSSAALIFIKNVTVRDATYALSAQSEIKVLFDANDKAAETPDASKLPDSSTKSSSGLGHVAQIIASGGVKMEASDDKGVKNYAVGDQALYDAKTDEIILRGARLIFQRGTESRFESNNADAWLLFNKKTKSFSMSEGWTAKLSMPK